MTTVRRLQNWYCQQCDGEWEHSHGVKIDTLDNPGWSVDIYLVGTPLFNQPMKKLERLGGTDWINCEVSDGHFRGFGGSGNLEEILEVFLSWAT